MTDTQIIDLTPENIAEYGVCGYILETAKKINIKADLIELKDAVSVQDVPCAFGTFCIIYNGEVISHHPISNARFENIMKGK